MMCTDTSWLAPLLVLTAIGCSSQSVDVDTAERLAPSSERLIDRSRDRLALMCERRWAEVYTYLDPDIRNYMSVDVFLAGKVHRYSEPAAPEVIDLDGTTAYVRARLVLWHGGCTMGMSREDIENGLPADWVETWDYVEGEWYMRYPPQYPNDFFELHPEFSHKE